MQMRAQTRRWNLLTCTSLVILTLLIGVPAAQAAITWDGGNDTDWWFDTGAPVPEPPETPTSNWSYDAAQILPPMKDADEDPATPDDLSVADAKIDPPLDGNTWDQGDGVVFDPANDPNYAASFGLRWIGPYGPHSGDPTWGNSYVIWSLYMARGNIRDGVVITGTAKLTIRGDLAASNWLDDAGGTEQPQWLIGRESGVSGVAANAIVIQESGLVRNNLGDIDLGANDSSNPLELNAFGNGTWDYRGGTLEQGFNGSATTARLRLSGGGSRGVGGIGTFIMRNPGDEAGGHVRVEDFQVAPFGGQNGYEPDGVGQGVGIAEFHYDNGDTRPIQITNNLTLNNGPDPGSDPGVRSCRLRLVLDEAPVVDVNGVPINLGLFDVDSDGNEAGSITAAPAQTQNDYGLTFSNADAPDPLATSAVYDNLTDSVGPLSGSDNIVTAMFGASTYRWRIYYDGNITWSDYDDSIVNSVTWDEENPGVDVVLIGLDSIIVEEGAIGDYNDDGVVDAADYTVWRDNLGTSFELPNRDPDNSGNVSEADWTSWKAHFGETDPGAGALAAGAVPEPSSLVLMIAVAVLCLGKGLASRR
jgi:hypothetical protein